MTNKHEGRGEEEVREDAIESQAVKEEKYEEAEVVEEEEQKGTVAASLRETDKKA